MKYEEQVCCQK